VFGAKVKRPLTSILNGRLQLVLHQYSLKSQHHSKLSLVVTSKTTFDIVADVTVVGPSLTASIVQQQLLPC
jgi:hypothetical protein